MQNLTTTYSELITKYYILSVSPFLLLIILATFLLNIHIILNILINKKLHTPINMFIVSLSFNGVNISTTSMPFSFSYVIRNFKWMFNLDTCIFWYIEDFSVCTRFILNFIIIMFIRYMAIEKPNDTWTSKKKQILIFIIINVLPLLFWAIIIGLLFPRKNLLNDCYLLINRNDLIILDLLFFGIPLMILIFVNFKLILKLRKRSKMITCSTNNRIFLISFQKTNQLISKF
jgi:hypothetical protein